MTSKPTIGQMRGIDTDAEDPYAEAEVFDGEGWVPVQAWAEATRPPEPEPIRPPEPEPANAVATHVLLCNSPGCPNRGHHVQVHEDTVFPAHCGGCGKVLHCDHDVQQRTVRAGTLGDPIEHRETHCPRCSTVFERKTRRLDPIPLASLPISILDTPLQ